MTDLGRSVFFHSRDGCWQCKRWWRRTLEPGSREPDRTSPAITIFHFFLPTAPLERKEENLVHGLYHRHLPQVGPTYSHFWLSFPGGSCPRTSVAGFLTAPHGVLLSCLPHLPFPHSSKPPWPQWGVLSPPQDPQLPPVYSSCPQSQGYSAEVKSPGPTVSWVKPDRDYASTTHCWKVDVAPCYWRGSTSLPAA